jgi:predicted nucleotidyltransferase
MPEKTSLSEILNQYQEALLTQFPDQVQRLVLFGSQARQEPSPESDIDVLVIVSWEEEQLAEGHYAAPFNDPRWRMIVELAYDLTLEYGVTLSPLVMSEKRFKQWSPLNNRIKQDGIDIWKKN